MFMNNLYAPERDGTAVFDAITKLNHGDGTKSVTITAHALVFYWLHAFVGAQIDLIYMNTNSVKVGF